MKKPTIILTKKSVNSKILCDIIDDSARECIEETIHEWDSEYARDYAVNTFNRFVSMQFAASGKITHWDINCDRRNNKMKDMDQGKYQFIVKYNQKNCLNVTQLIYDIEYKK